MTKAYSPNHVRLIAPATNYKIICDEVQPGSTAQLTPGKLQKVVHLVRHGQAYHNGKSIAVVVVFIFRCLVSTLLTFSTYAKILDDRFSQFMQCQG